MIAMRYIPECLETRDFVVKGIIQAGRFILSSRRIYSDTALAIENNEDAKHPCVHKQRLNYLKYIKNLHIRSDHYSNRSE